MLTRSVETLHFDAFHGLAVLDEVSGRVHVGTEMLILGELIALKP